MELSAQARRAPEKHDRSGPWLKEKPESGPERRREPRVSGVVRRAVDVIASLVLLVLTSPLMIAGVALVALTSGRPFLFGHRRVGKGGRVFRCWKIRTMRVDAEKVLELEPELGQLHREHGFKLPAAHDPRIVPGGRWLRKTHLDELPQLFNVLVGDMSLIGPRPIVREELELFGRDAKLLLSTRPGLFGAWTSLGRRRPPYPERAHIELDWVRRRSARTDLLILLRSMGAVVRGQEEG